MAVFLYNKVHKRNYHPVAFIEGGKLNKMNFQEQGNTTVNVFVVL